MGLGNYLFSVSLHPIGITKLDIISYLIYRLFIVYIRDAEYNNTLIDMIKYTHSNGFNFNIHNDFINDLYTSGTLLSNKATSIRRSKINDSEFIRDNIKSFITEEFNISQEEIISKIKVYSL